MQAPAKELFAPTWLGTEPFGQLCQHTLKHFSEFINFNKPIPMRVGC
jgi:hypothetical protein